MWDTGAVNNSLTLCSILFLQIANLASGASGALVWRRTKHVDLRKARSLGFVYPFSRSTAQTPPRPLYPHRPALHRQRERSAWWPRLPVSEVNIKKHMYYKEIWKELKVIVVKLRRQNLNYNWISSKVPVFHEMLWPVDMMTDGTITQHPETCIPASVCDPQRVDWVWFGWDHRGIQNLLTSQHVNNKLHRAKQMKGGHYALQSWTRIRAGKGYLFWGPLKHEVYTAMACLLGPLSSTQQVNSQFYPVNSDYQLLHNYWPCARLWQDIADRSSWSTIYWMKNAINEFNILPAVVLKWKSLIFLLLNVTKY